LKKLSSQRIGPAIVHRNDVVSKVLPVDLAVVDPAVVVLLAPTAMWVWASLQEQAIGIAAQLRDRMGSKINDHINV
jgi:hypothetical protein